MASCTLVDMVAAAAARFPHSCAVSRGSSFVSFSMLERRANQIARRLRAVGVEAETPVGVFLERSPDAVCAMLGVLKAGGVYVPLEPGHPSKRLAFICEDARIDVVVDRALLLESEVCDDGPLGTSARPEDAAYIVYTSGSTGIPKGVVVEHGSLGEHIASVLDVYGWTPADRALPLSSLGFDASIEEACCALAAGTRLVLWDETIVPAAEFFERCARDRISVISIPTALWHALVAELEERPVPIPQTLRQVVIGGERPSFERVRAWQRLAPHVELINSYGPTETTITAAAFRVPSPLDERTVAERDIPIGRAVSGALIVGASDELYVAGRRVARGYLRRPELTGERFMTIDVGGRPERAYRTGDIVRRRDDGLLVYCGRTDDQVKIRGFRVELGEVEAALLAHTPVRECAVVAVEGPAGLDLVAFVCRSGAATAVDVRALVAPDLPEYMVPAAFIDVERLPLTVNGKVDRSALAELARGHVAATPVPADALTDAQSRVAAIFEEVLGRRGVGAQDSFFDLGGHSLSALRVLSRLRERYGLTLTFREIFKAPRVADVAERLETSRAPAL
jgi:amino acid adenylation domain-containing protein